MTASRAMFQSRECVTTAPPTDFIDVHAGKLVAIGEPVEGRRQHLEIGEVRVQRVGSAEWDTYAADDGHPAKFLAHRCPALHYSAATRCAVVPSDVCLA